MGNSNEPRSSKTHPKSRSLGPPVATRGQSWCAWCAARSSRGRQLSLRRRLPSNPRTADRAAGSTCARARAGSRASRRAPNAAAVFDRAARDRARSVAADLDDEPRDYRRFRLETRDIRLRTKNRSQHGWRTADSGQRTADSGQRDSGTAGQRTAGQRTADSGQRTADSGQWTADSGQRTAEGGQRTQRTQPMSTTPRCVRYTSSRFAPTAVTASRNIRPRWPKFWNMS